ncbi:MAG: thioredoxin domain-containing protein [Candidatus Peribacteria bacterium]|nr:MAG: thioredoxin domain-containing protein [Candidatus Peribacteria bacterium]
MFKQEYAISRGFATALLVLCTLAMILSNYIFTKDIAKEIDGYLMQHEYQKIGGEENYRILQELQKREILSYLDTLKREQPEVIDEILASISEAKNDTVTVDASKLDIEAGDLDALLEDTSVYGGTGAMVTLLEFSDFECPYCKEQHMSGVISELRDIYGDDLQYAFKNFPLAQHTHAMNLAIQAKCIEKL